MSLTPAEDAIRRGLAEAATRANLDDRMAAAGFAGVEARIAKAMTEAYALALAREHDRGTPQEDILTGFTQALASIVASIAASSVKGDAMAAIGAILINRMSVQAAVLLADFVTGARTGVTVPIDPVHRA